MATSGSVATGGFVATGGSVATVNVHLYSVPATAGFNAGKIDLKAAPRVRRG